MPDPSRSTQEHSGNGGGWCSDIVSGLLELNSRSALKFSVLLKVIQLQASFPSGNSKKFLNRTGKIGFELTPPLQSIVHILKKTHFVQCSLKTAFLTMCLAKSFFHRCFGVAKFTYNYGKCSSGSHVSSSLFFGGCVGVTQESLRQIKPKKGQFMNSSPGANLNQSSMRIALIFPSKAPEF